MHIEPLVVDEVFVLDASKWSEYFRKGLALEILGVVAFEDLVKLVAKDVSVVVLVNLLDISDNTDQLIVSDSDLDQLFFRYWL